MYHIPNLNRRLLSLVSLSATQKLKVTILRRATTLSFPDKSSYTWPVALANLRKLPMDAMMCTHDKISPPSKPEQHVDQPDKDPKTLPNKAPQSLNLELTSLRLGLKNVKTLLTGSLHTVWHNQRLVPTTSVSDWPVRISISHKRARSKKPQPDGPTPFHQLHLDLIKNPFRYGLTQETNYSAYLFIVATPGRYVGWQGIHTESSLGLFNALKQWLTKTELLGRTDKVRLIRADAGSAFVSPKFIDRCVDLGIKVEAASPKHQEMNGICEAKWKQLHNLANTLLNNARLGGAFFHHAHAYAAAILNHIPARNVVDQNDLPSTPHFVCFGQKPRLTNFRVFGSPTYFKRYDPKRGNKSISNKQQIQKSSRGIFVGFPDNSAGWLVYSAELPQRLLVTSDAYFDEKFESALAFDSKPFAGAVPIRPAMDPSALTTNISASESTPMDQTGTVADLGIDLSTFSESNKHIVEEGADKTDKPITSTSKQNKQDTINCYVEEPEPDLIPNNDESSENLESFSKESLQAISEIEQDFHECHEVSPLDDHVLTAMEVIQQLTKQTTDNPTQERIDKYLPEPQSLKSVLRLDDDIRDAWLHSIFLEIKNLIDNDTFILGETMQPGELLVRTKIVLKAKQLANGLLEKLKARIVARGDMEKRRMKRHTKSYKEALETQKTINLEAKQNGHTPQIVEIPEPYEDTWSPCASSRGVKLLLADLCKRRRTVKGADFIGAYLQAKVVGRHFVMLPIELKEFFPQYAKYFGVPLLLNKGMYGLVYSGKYWNVEFSEWLYSQGFYQSSADPSFFIKRFKHGQWLKLIFFVDDMLYAGSTDQIEKDFEQSVTKRFHVKFQGPAQWFLQMRIHQYHDGTYTLDQHRFAMNIIQRFDKENKLPKRDTPLPIEYIYSKSNRPKDDNERAQVEKKYHYIHFRSAVCTLLYAAYNTRADILFAVCKLAKACTCPGEQDYIALLWLIGYVKNKPDLAIKFYPDRKHNPIYDICLANNIPYSDLTIMTDASWQDCPDTGRSTVGYMIFYQGALIEANSTVPTPVAMSTAEAEYMGACCGAMAAAHIRMLIYDMMHLGSKSWKQASQSLAETPNLLMIDNEAAVQMARNGKLSRKARHVERRFHFVRQGQESGFHSLNWVPGDLQLADILTKTQHASKIDPHLEKVMTKLPAFLTKAVTSK